MGFGQFKIGKVKARTNRAAYKRKIGAWCGPAGKPAVGGYYVLKGLPRSKVVAQYGRFQAAVKMQGVHMQGAACVKVPAFIAFDFVKAGKIALFQQKVNTRSKVSAACKTSGQAVNRYAFGRAVGFFVVAALGVGQQAVLLY